MNRKEPRAGCIVIDANNKILIVHNTASGYWGFPKGGKKGGESYLDAAFRELKEETGKTVSADNIKTSFSKNSSRMFLIMQDINHWCKVDNKEIDNYAWVDINTIKKLRMSNFTKYFVAKVENFIQNKFLPVQAQ